MAADESTGGTYEPVEREGETDLSVDQDKAVRMIANNLHRLNDSIVQAARAGVTVELMRASRYHSDSGAWGDQMIPIITRQG